VKFISTVLLDTYEGPSDPSPAPETVPGESEIDLGWKPEGRQKRKKGKQMAQGQDHSDLQLLEEESKVRPILILLTLLPIEDCRNTDGG